MHPPHVRRSLPRRMQGRLGQHVGVGIQADGLVDQGGELDGQDSRTASHVEKASRPVQPALDGHCRTQLSGVGRSAPEIVGGASAVERRVVRSRFRHDRPTLPRGGSADPAHRQLIVGFRVDRDAEGDRDAGDLELRIPGESGAGRAWR